jgi:hypothetical protein
MEKKTEKIMQTNNPCTKQRERESEKETHWEMAAKTRMGKYLTDVETIFITKAVDFSTRVRS